MRIPSLKSSPMLYQMRRRTLFILFGLVAAALPLALLSWVKPRDSVSSRNLATVEFGMALPEVSEILGRPPADMKPTPYAGSYDPKEFHETGVVQTAFWYSAELTAQVGFDAAGTVVWKSGWIAPIPRWRDDSIRGRVTRWFGF